MSERIAKTGTSSEVYEPYVPGQHSETQDPRPRPQIVDVSTIMSPEAATQFTSSFDSQQLKGRIKIDTMSADELLQAMRSASGDEVSAARILEEKHAQQVAILHSEGSRGVTAEQVHDAYQRMRALEQVEQALRERSTDPFGGLTSTEDIYKRFLSNADLGVLAYNSNAEHAATQSAGTEVMPLKRKRAGKLGGALRRLAGRLAA